MTTYSQRRPVSLLTWALWEGSQHNRKCATQPLNPGLKVDRINPLWTRYLRMQHKPPSDYH